MMFDPDWNPASDKQAAARIWREGQRRRCFIYRLMSTGTVEEKIIQRQLSKEGLQNIVDDTDQVNEFSSAELKAIFVRRTDTISDTHDTLRCDRCSTVVSKKLLSNGHQLTKAQGIACRHFLERLIEVLRSALHGASVVILPVLLLIKSDGNDDVNMDTVSDSENELVSLESLRKFNEECVHLGTPQCPPGMTTLPQFSRRLRETVVRVDVEYREKISAVAVHYQQFYATGVMSSLDEQQRTTLSQVQEASKLSISGEYMKLWGAEVESLTELGKCSSVDPGIGSSADPVSDRDCDGVDDADGDASEPVEFVEQVGCPDDEDVNKWSHHAHVNTCDDECMRRAMVDDPSVSICMHGFVASILVLSPRYSSVFRLCSAWR